MSQPPSIFSTPYSNPQSISSQHCTTSRATTVTASPCHIATSTNVNVTKLSHSAVVNSSSNDAIPTNLFVTKLNPPYSLNYSSTPNISSDYTLSPYCTGNHQSLRTSQSCSICNLSTYCHQCNMPPAGLESPSNRYTYSNSSSECFVQSPLGGFHRTRNLQIPLKNMLHTRLEGTQNSERFLSSISCPNIPLKTMSSKIPPVRKTTVSTSIARSSLSSHTSPTNMPPPVVTVSGIPTPPIPLRKLSTLNLSKCTRQPVAYMDNLESISSNQIACTSSEFDRLQTMQWAKAISLSNIPGSNATTEGVSCSSLSSNLPSSSGAAVHDHSKNTNIKQYRKRRKVNIIPLHKIVSFHQNYMKTCKSKTQLLDHITVKNEKITVKKEKINVKKEK